MTLARVAAKTAKNTIQSAGVRNWAMVVWEIIARLYVLVYSLAMKYVLIFVAIVIMVRIDVVLNLIDKASKKLKSEESTSVSEAPSDKKLISFSEDKSIQQTPRKTLLSLFNNYAISPNKENRLKVMNMLSTTPTLIGPMLDIELEAAIYRLRDNLITKNGDTFQFLMDLQTLLTGENLLMVRKFISLLMDTDIDYFLKYYSHSKDTECTVATLLADNLPDEEKLNEFYDREGLLNAFLLKDTQDLKVKNYATTCLGSLRIHLDRIAPPPAPETAPAQEAAPAPAEESL
jgi:hypothetical protein